MSDKVCATCANRTEPRDSGTCRTCNVNERYVCKWKEDSAVTAYKKIHEEISRDIANDFK